MVRITTNEACHNTTSVPTIPPMKKKYQCEDCGHEFQVTVAKGDPGKMVPASVSPAQCPECGCEVDEDMAMEAENDPEGD